MKNPSLSFDEVSACLRYEDGHLYWKITTGTVRVGDRCATVSRHGYIRLQLRGHYLLAHRVIWLLCTGSWPEKQLDHVNTDGLDNRISNLRECSPSQNGGNRAANRSRAGKLKGVVAVKRGFQSQIASRYLGHFKTAEEAGLAYDVAAIARFGEFARTNAMLRLPKEDK